MYWYEENQLSGVKFVNVNAYLREPTHDNGEEEPEYTRNGRRQYTRHQIKRLWRSVAPRSEEIDVSR